MNEELNKQFAVKNDAIFKNKLVVDINNNSESLVLTLNNLLNLMFEDAQGKLQEIFESIIYKENIQLYIDKIRKIFFPKLEEILLYKKNKLLNFVDHFDIGSIKVSSYQEQIKTVNDQVFSEIDTLYQNHVDHIILEINELKTNQFLYERYTDFYQRFKNLLKEKIKMQFFDRDNNLINNFNESYNKYININKNTIDKY